MKSAVEDTKPDRIGFHRCMRLKHLLEFGDILRRGVLCRLAHCLAFDETAAFSTLVEDLGRQRQHEVERRQKPLGVEPGDIGAPPMADLDNPKRGERSERFPQSGTTYSEDLDQFAFGRQPVTGPQIAGPHELEYPVEHLGPDALPVLGLVATSRDMRRFWPTLRRLPMFPRGTIGRRRAARLAAFEYRHFQLPIESGETTIACRISFQ